MGLDHRPQCADKTRDGQHPTPQFADARRNSPCSRRTIWLMAPGAPWERCSRRPAACRSCSRSSPDTGGGRLRRQPGSTGRQHLTRFATGEYGVGGKWVELLNEMAPRTLRAAVLRNSANPAELGHFSAIQTMAQSLRVEVDALNVRPFPTAVERDVAAFAQAGNGGLIITASRVTASSRSDRHDCGPTQAARGLFSARLRLGQQDWLPTRPITSTSTDAPGRLRGSH